MVENYSEIYMMELLRDLHDGELLRDLHGGELLRDLHDGELLRDLQLTSTSLMIIYYFKSYIPKLCVHISTYHVLCADHIVYYTNHYC